MHPAPVGRSYQSIKKLRKQKNFTYCNHIFLRYLSKSGEILLIPLFSINQLNSSSNFSTSLFPVELLRAFLHVFHSKSMLKMGGGGDKKGLKNSREIKNSRDSLTQYTSRNSSGIDDAASNLPMRERDFPGFPIFLYLLLVRQKYIKSLSRAHAPPTAPARRAIYFNGNSGIPRIFFKCTRFTSTFFNVFKIHQQSIVGNIRKHREYGW